MSTDPRDPWPWERPRSKGSLAVLIGLGIAFAIACGGVMAAFVALGIGIETGHFPDTKAVPGSKLSDRSLGFLRRKELLAEGEEVLYFYSGGLFDVEGDGSFFTDRRVVRYTSDQEGGGFQSWTADYPEILAIESEFETGWLADSTIRVLCDDDRKIELVVCNDEGGDKLFAERLEAQWKERRGAEGPR
jgi:hypothetical protein